MQSVSLTRRIVPEVLVMPGRLVLAVTLVIVLCLPVPLALAAGDAAPTLRIIISPLGGLPGTDITVIGEGARPGIPVKVMLVKDGKTGEGLFNQGEVDPADDGKFLTNIPVPGGTGNGTYAVRAEQRNQAGGLIQYWWVGFHVGDLPLLPITGALPPASSTPTAALAALLSLTLLGQGLRRAFRR
jgi:hypothetical protein